MNPLKTLLLTILNISVSILANPEIYTDDQYLLETIYQACPQVKASLAGFSAGLYSAQARILLALLASRLEEIEKCPSLADLSASLTLFENCVVQASLKDLEQASSCNQDRQLALALRHNPEVQKKHEQEIRRACQLQISRRLAQR